MKFVSRELLRELIKKEYATKLRKYFYIYLLKEIGQIFVLSLGIFTFLLVLGRLGKLTDLVINKGVGIKDIILLIIYSTPPYLTFTLPMSFLLATIVVFGRLASENEILALKANGVDLKNLFMPIIALGLAISLFGLLNTHFLLPKSSTLFLDTLMNVIKKGISIEDKEGIFNDTIPGVVIYIDKVDAQNKTLTGVIVSDDRDKDIKQTISAQKGIINLDSNTLDLNFVLENGNLHRWEKKTDVYRNVSFKNYTYSMNLTVLPYQRELRKRPYEMDRSELKYLLLYANNTTNPTRYDLLLEIYKKISLPLSSLAFVLLTIPLGIRRKIGGKFAGIVYSLLLFVFYYIVLGVTENIGKTFNLSVFLISFTPNVVIALIGITLMRDINGEEPAKISQHLRYIWGRYFEKA